MLDPAARQVAVWRSPVVRAARRGRFKLKWRRRRSKESFRITSVYFRAKREVFSAFLASGDPTLSSPCLKSDFYWTM